MLTVAPTEMRRPGPVWFIALDFAAALAENRVFLCHSRSFMSTLLSRIRVVLCNTSHPGNIGSAARAMKTMGITRLDLVRPRRMPDEEAFALASGAGDVLEGVRVHGSLDAALSGTVLAAGFSSRRRELAPMLYSAREAAQELLSFAQHGEVALVFGSETFGLSIEELSRCHLLVSIPANPEYASLNLAQAVQIAAYELFMATSGDAPRRNAEGRPATFDEVEGLLVHLESAMLGSGFLDPEQPGRLMQRMRRMFGRTRLETEEVNILRGVLRSLEGEQPGRDVPTEVQS